MSLVDDIKKDPLGAGLAICLPVLAIFSVSYLLNNLTKTVEQDNVGLALDDEEIHAEDPQPEWLANAKAADIMTVPGRPIAYWARDDVDYGPTSKGVPYKGIVMHYTLPARRGTSHLQWVIRLIKYQHNGDLSRRGSFGYHFYIDREGKIYQGAPMTYRTNHVKPSRSRHRKPGPGRVLNNTNSVGISMIGACMSVGEGIGTRCVGEKVTPKQMASGTDLIAALKKRYDLDCLIFGHGELQRDRNIYEGLTMSKHIRSTCEGA